MPSILTGQEAQLFYKLWMPLLDYVNQTYRVNPNLAKIENPKESDQQEIRIVSTYLWNHPEIIDQYLTVAELSPEHRKIVAEWKHFVKDSFILERHLQKGSVFMPLSNGKLYIVNGIDSSFEEMFAGTPLPILLETTLIPFKDKIICSDIVINRNVTIGRGYIEAFKEIYMTAKKEKAICTSL